MHRAALSYAAVAQEPPLSDEEVVRTWAGLIDRVARRVSARTAGTVTPQELWSVGALGLIDAYRRFDPARAVKFESFAEHRIRGAMIDELREMDHLPRRLRADTDRVRRARQALVARLGRDPTTDELAQHLMLPVEDVEALDALAHPAVPLSPELQIPCGSEPQDEQVERAERVALVEKAVEKLPQRQQLVLQLHYVEGLTYREIGQVLEVSEARVCQIHGEAIRKLRSGVVEDDEEG